MVGVMVTVTVMVMVGVMVTVTVMVMVGVMVTVRVRVGVTMSQETISEIIKTFERAHPLTKTSRKLEDKHPEKFAAALELRRRGYTIPAIARGLNISPDALQKALLRVRSE